MFSGLSAGIFWGLETLILGLALVKTPFVGTAEAIFLAPFLSTFLHDSCSALWMLLLNGVRGDLKRTWNTLVHTKGGKFIVLGAVIGGPIGMTGYVMCVKYMGASIGAIASAIYPVIGAVLAHFFLKEKMQWYRWIALIVMLLGVYGLSYSPELDITNFTIGIIGALVCSVGWSVENIILAKCLKDPDVPFQCALQIRQTTSAILTGLVTVLVFGGWELTANVLFHDTENVLLTIALAALCGTASYLFFAYTLEKYGAVPAMALNSTYFAWTMVFTAIFLGDMSVVTPLTVTCAIVVLVFSILAAGDVASFFRERKIKKP